MTTNATGAAELLYLRRLCRLFAVGMVVLLGILAMQWWRDSAGRDAAADEVRTLLSTQQAAWNAGDLDGFMAGYRMSEDITFYSEGKVETGWVGLRERYEKKYRAGGQSMGTLTFSDVTVDVLAPDAALARGRWKVEWEGRTASGFFTILLREFPEGWRIVHDHTSAAP